MTAEVRELTRLALSLWGNAAEAEASMVAVVERGALNVKNGWRENAAASSGRHARRYPFSVSYDITPIPGGARAEIGPDKAKPQGPLGNLLEFGSVNNAPHNDGGRALLVEEPLFAAQVSLITERLGRL